MKHLFVVFLVLACVVEASAQSDPVKLAVCLSDEALDGMVIEEDGSATLDEDKASSLVSLNQNNELIAMYPMTYKPGSPFRGFFTFLFDENADLESLKESYETNEFVQWVSLIPEDESEVLGPYYPPDPKFSDDQMWYAHQGTDKADVNGPEAWEWTLGDTSVVIAICGGGINWLTANNEQSDDVAANLWTNWGEIPDNEIDDDNNGFVDDIHGWNFYPYSGHPNGDNDIEYHHNPWAPDYLWWHGTPMASEAASAIDSCISKNCGVGVAPRCRIMGVPDGSSTVRTAYSVIYAVDNGAKVFVSGFGFDSTLTFFREVVLTAFNEGMLFVNAGGNLNTPLFDVSYGVSVATLDSNNVPVSRTGNLIKLSAPALYSGSSYAAPVAAGVAALMRSLNPYISLETLRRIFVSPASCNPVPYSGTGAGRIDAFKALKNVGATATLDTIINDSGCPLLSWTVNTFLDSSGVFNSEAINYIVQRKWAYDTGYVDIATLSSSITSYKDEEILISYFSDIFSYRIVTKIAYGGNYMYSVPSNKKDIRGEFLKPATATETMNVPAETKLFDNYPNPFNPATQIWFELAMAGIVKLKVYDVLGREVHTLVDEHLEPGNYHRVFDAAGFASGIYYYNLTAPGYSKTRKFVVIK